jgi:hypothetical protein|tara:strand:- start:632 stop:2020 length:1389 start_codon:yes stop_codon:yes gene_type:complete
MPSINNFLKGFQDGLPGMKDYQHASRLYIDDNYKLMPKQKFLYHVVFNTDETLFDNGFNQGERYDLNMLVKACDLPKYDLSYEEKVQYNKKMYNATRIAYEPVNITFHDDHADTVNAFWKKYYEYNIADSVGMNSDLTISNTKDDYYQFGDNRATTKFGLDTPKLRNKPYLKGIEIFVLHKKRFTSMTLVNPVIGSFSHDNLDQADGTGVLQNTMQILYETVIYKSGIVNRNNVPGFATINYDNSPSPLTVLGGGTNSIFGPGGVVDGVGSVIRNVQSGNILGAILGASNTYNNAKKIKKRDIKEELKGIAKDGILEVGKQAGSITNPVAQFTVGAAVTAGVVLASARGTADNKDQANNTIITNPSRDTVNFLTSDEAFNLVSNDETVREEIAAGIYFKDIGSRKNLSVSESDIEYAGGSDNVKNVYTNKAITDIRKLVTEGYIKIERQTLNVEVQIEKLKL